MTQAQRQLFHIACATNSALLLILLAVRSEISSFAHKAISLVYLQLSLLFQYLVCRLLHDREEAYLKLGRC